MSCSIGQVLEESRRRRKSKKNVRTELGGFVVEFGFPRMSDGSDHVVSFTIGDEMYEELRVNMFSNTHDTLPRFRSEKPFVLLRNITIRYDGDNNPKGVCYKQDLSFAVFDLDSDPDTPVQSSPGFRLSPRDVSLVRRMAGLTQTYRVSTSVEEDYLVSMDSLGKRTFADIICRVLHVQRLPQQQRWIIYVWDGKDAPPLPIRPSSSSSSNDYGGDGDADQTLPLRIEETPLDMSVLTTFPRLGTVLRVKTGVDMTGLFPVPKWLKIRNLKIAHRHAMWFASFVASSKLRLLHHSDHSVLDCLRAAEERGLLKPSPLSHLTVIGNDSESSFPFGTLMDLMTQSAQEEGITMRCVVRVMAISHWDAKKFKKESNGAHNLKFTLEDPTARVTALLLPQDRDLFFKDVENDVISMKMDEMLGISNSEDDDTQSPRNPPWIQCCLNSFHIHTAIYSMCHTKLLP